MTEMKGQIDWREREGFLGVELVEASVWLGVFPGLVAVRLGGGFITSAEMARVKVGGRKGRGHWEEMWAADIEEGKEKKRIIFRPNGEKDLKYHRIEKYSEEKKRWIRLPAQEAVGILQGLAL